MNKININNTLQKKGGFTLIETLMTIFIFSVIMVAAVAMFASLYKDQAADIAKIESTEKASNAVEIMAKEIRKINRGENGNYFFQVVQSQRLVFFSDVDNDSLTEKIEYILDGTELKRQLTEPGADADYSGGATTTIVADNVRNGADAVFDYYNSSYTGSGSSLTEPVNAVEVSLVEINLDISTNLQSLSSPIHVETKIHPRNLKNFN